METVQSLVARLKDQVTDQKIDFVADIINSVQREDAMRVLELSVQDPAYAEDAYKLLDIIQKYRLNLSKTEVRELVSSNYIGGKFQSIIADYADERDPDDLRDLEMEREYLFNDFA